MIGLKVTVNDAALAEVQMKLQAIEQQLPDVIRDKQTELAERATKAMKDKHGADAHDIQRYVNRTWDLTESIGYNLEPTQHHGADLQLHPMRVFAAAPYAFDVENGVPGRSRAYPFFWQELTGGPHVEAFPADLAQAAHDLLASVAERS